MLRFIAHQVEKELVLPLDHGGAMSTALAVFDPFLPSSCNAHPKKAVGRSTRTPHLPA
jgi:hypothetical protein